MRHLSTFITLALMCIGLHASGNSPVTMQVTRSNVAVDEVFQVVYDIVSHTESAPTINVPAIKGCTLLEASLPQTDMRYSIDPRINTDYVLYTRYVYTYRADRAGRTEIKPATANIGGEKFKSGSGVVNITKPDENVPAQGDIFMKLDLSTRHAEIGEPVTLAVMLYSRWRLDDYASYGEPVARNCSINRVPTGPERLPDEIIDGTVYGVWVLARYVITPSRKGKVTVTPPPYGIAPDYRNDNMFFQQPGDNRRFACTPASVVLEVSGNNSGKHRDTEQNDKKTEPKVVVPDGNIIYVMATTGHDAFQQL